MTTPDAPTPAAPPADAGAGDAADGSVRYLDHVRVRLALHQLRAGSGRALLLLHGLGEHTPAAVPEAVAAWPGPVFGLDLTGHGATTIPVGGGYTSEVLMADVDRALAELGEATIVGRGLGAYIALLVAGARPELVHGVVLCDGPGLAGGGPAPQSPAVVIPATRAGTPDVFALAELSRDVRPGDYASTYARQALQFSGLDTPISVVAVVRPPWLEAVVAEPGVELATSVAEALVRYST